MFLIHAAKNKLTVLEDEPLTSGSVNVYPVRFRFSAGWDGLTKTAVFQARTAVSVLLDETGECTIPWEVLEQPDYTLKVGVYGTQGETVVLPTIWADLGAIQPGAEPGEAAREPTPDVYQQIMAAIESGKLQGPAGTSPTVKVTKENGVATITITTAAGDTVFKIRDGGDGAGVESITLKSSTADGNTYAVALSDGTSYEITAPAGPAGVSGVYVGSGEMPEGYNVQIDPEGEPDLPDPGDSTGDMIQAVYDPQGKKADVFRYADDAAAAAKPKTVSVTLAAAGWDVATLTQTVEVAGVLEDGSGQLVTPYPADDASYQAYGAANVRCYAWAADSMTFTCDVMPAEDINLTIKLEATE